MEARRLELLQEKDGYWSKRMAAEEQAHAAELAETQAGAPSKVGIVLSKRLALEVAGC